MESAEAAASFLGGDFERSDAMDGEDAEVRLRPGADGRGTILDYEEAINHPAATLSWISVGIAARPGEPERRQFYVRERGKWLTFTHPVQVARAVLAMLAGREVFDNMASAGYDIVNIVFRYAFRPSGQRPNY